MAQTKPSPSPISAPGLERWPAAGLFAVFLLAALAAYGPALNGALLWDDAGHVTNPALQSWSGLLRIWFEPGVTQQYYPLLHSAFWLEHRIWGDAVLGYHLINVLQHVTAATLLAVLLRRLAVPGAWMAAALFLLHPVCVESVAWISEQKNTLSLVFYLWAALTFLRFDQTRDSRAYALATVLFACALLTKSVTASLPAALLVVFWWQRGRLDWRRDVLPLLPWLILGAGGGLFTAHFERELIGAQGADFALGAMDRLVLAGRVFWFYLGKLVWPAEVIFVYPRWQVDASVGWQWLFPLAGLGLLAALAWWSRRSRAPLAAALLFGGSLFPVLGFVNVYPFIFSYVADHFQYLASLAVFALAGAALSRLPRPAGAVTAVLVAALLGVLTWHETPAYRDSRTLYETTLARNPDAWLAHHNLALLLSDAGEADRALPHLERTLALRPDYAEALNNYGDCLRQVGRAAEAVAPLERAIRLKPRYAEAHNSLGVVRMTLGQNEAGLASFQRALDLQPKLVLARINYAWALANSGRPAEALVQLEQARREHPENADAELKTTLVYAMSNHPADALPHARRAVELNSESAETRQIYGALLLQLGRPTEAGEQFEAVLELNPNHPGAQLGLQQVRQMLGRR